MKNNKLRDFEISSFDIELDFNKKIAPINQKIDKINKEQENKSLEAHKDFLAKGKLANEKIQELNTLFNISKKLIQDENDEQLQEYVKKDESFNTEIDNFISKATKENDLLIQGVQKEVEKLKETEALELLEVNKKYQVNVANQVKKLDTYTANFEKNFKQQESSVLKYSIQLGNKIKEIEEIKNTIDKAMDDKLQKFLSKVEKEDKNASSFLEKAERDLDKGTSIINKDVDYRIKDINLTIKDMKADLTKRYNGYITLLNNQIDTLNTKATERSKLIDKDLEVNLERLKKELKADPDPSSAKAQKSIKMKYDLFELRATTTKQYEKELLDEEIELIHSEIKHINHVLDGELTNLDKLELYLLNDQNEIRDAADYLKSLNLNIISHLKSFEAENNEYLAKHNQLKNNFVKRYNEIFHDFKTYIINSNQEKLHQLFEINKEIDDINRYLANTDPYKEIKVNDLRESIEGNEIRDKYRIIYAKYDYRIQLLNNELAAKIDIKKAEMSDLVSKNKIDIQNIRNKIKYEIALKKAKLNLDIAAEQHDLKLISSALEEQLLKDENSSEIEINNLEIEKVAIETPYKNLLQIRKLESEIENVETALNYDAEVLRNQLSQDTIKLNSQMAELEYNRHKISSSVDNKIAIELITISEKKHQVNIDFDKKIKLINEAMTREVKEPMRSMSKFKSFITEELNKLEYSNLLFQDFVNTFEIDINDTALTLPKLLLMSKNSETIKQQIKKYIERSYSTLEDAINLMLTIEGQSLDIKVSSVPTGSALYKKIQKLIPKVSQERELTLEYFKKAKQENEQTILSECSALFESFETLNTNDFSLLREKLINIYHEVFNSLKALNKTIHAEVESLYSPLIQSDVDIIAHVEENASKAIALTENNRKLELQKVDDEILSFTKKQELNKDNQLKDILTDIKELQAKIYRLTENCEAEIQRLRSNSDKDLEEKRELIKSIRESEEETINELKEALHSKKDEIAESYNSMISLLSEKDAGYKTLYEYKTKSYDFEVERATSKYNEALAKSKAIFAQNITDNENSVSKINAAAAVLANDAQKELVDEIARIEQEILETRPRLQLEIQHSETEIDKEIFEKETKLKSLILLETKTIKALEENLHSSFQKGYANLLKNLENYLREYRVLSDEYADATTESNEVVAKNNFDLSNIIFELGRKKHEETKAAINEINTQIS